MISEELLSQVLNENVVGTVLYVDDNEMLYFSQENGDGGSYINIYELAHKCKEWALRNRYILESLSNRSCIMGEEYEYYATLKIHKEVSSMLFHNIDADTEQEAIFEACQWILDNKGNK